MAHEIKVAEPRKVNVKAELREVAIDSDADLASFLEAVNEVVNQHWSDIGHGAISIAEVAREGDRIKAKLRTYRLTGS